MEAILKVSTLSKVEVLFSYFQITNLSGANQSGVHLDIGVGRTYVWSFLADFSPSIFIGADLRDPDVSGTPFS